MTDPISSRNTPPISVDDYLHALTGAREDVRADDSRPTLEVQPEETGYVACEAFEAAHHAHQVYEVLRGPAHFAESIPVVQAALTGTAMVCGAAESFREGRILNEQYHYDMMRGALAGLEGRAGTPEVRAELGRNPAFRDGMQRVERADPYLVDDAITRVRRSRDEGYRAVVSGQDSGPAFLQRYHDDLAFHHAVDHARTARAANGPRWADIQRSVIAESPRTPSRG